VSLLNFTAEVGISKDGKWGSLNVDGKTWNGMVGMLVNKETDIVTAALTRGAIYQLIPGPLAPVSLFILTYLVTLALVTIYMAR
jgi:hypothetical protein